MPAPTTLLHISRLIIRALMALNLIAGVLSAIIFAGSMIFPGMLLDAAASTPTPLEPEPFLFFVRVSVFVAALLTVAVHVILLQIARIIDSVRGGHPFAADNASRLRTAAWALLVIQVGDTLIGYLAFSYAMTTGDNVAWGPSLGGWIAVLLLFILAHIFTVGANMHDDLEGTV